MEKSDLDLLDKNYKLRHYVVKIRPKYINPKTSKKTDYEYTYDRFYVRRPRKPRKNRVLKYDKEVLKSEYETMMGGGFPRSTVIKVLAQKFSICTRTVRNALKEVADTHVDIASDESDTSSE